MVKDVQIKTVIDMFNDNLKQIRTFEEFEKLEKNINEVGYGLVFRTKRAKWHAHSFTEINGEIKYLLGDGVSTRKTKLENLYKYIEISDRAR